MSAVSRFEFDPGYSISRIIKGGWQLAGGHGSINPAEALEDMRLFTSAGITTFDCADIYTGVEELIGSFRRRHPDLPVQVHTKYVPDLESLPRLSKADVQRIIDRSLARLNMERLDLVQFHWWDYEIGGYVEAAQHLQALQQDGKIRYIGVTNFDTPRLSEILAAGVPVKTIQVQYSVLDQRPQAGMVSLCRQHGISMLCYGTLAGGLLSEKYLGAPRPQPPFENRSLTKYMLIVEEFGGWELFQELLAALNQVARKWGVGLGEVGVRYVLQKAGVAAAIIGVRSHDHLSAALKIFRFLLDDEDLASIQKVIDRSPGLPGDVYDLERRKGGPHASIMKYNLNKE